MLAMKNATDNAEELIEDLTLDLITLARQQLLKNLPKLPQDRSN